MKVIARDVERYFRPLVGSHAWRVKIGVGSFLTFEFGRRTRSNGHIYGQWHLWIYLSHWELLHGKRRLVDSDADRKVIAAAVRRLENASLTAVHLDTRRKKTAFQFGEFLLQVSPADYLEDTTDRDSYWIFFMPENQVLTMGPSGLNLKQEKGGSVAALEEEEPRSTHAGRALRLED
jgi:hypothetical protein